MFKFEMSGFDELERKLNRLAENAEALDGETQCHSPSCVRPLSWPGTPSSARSKSYIRQAASPLKRQKTSRQSRMRSGMRSSPPLPNSGLEDDAGEGRGGLDSSRDRPRLARGHQVRRLHLACAGPSGISDRRSGGSGDRRHSSGRTRSPARQCVGHRFRAAVILHEPGCVGLPARALSQGYGALGVARRQLGFFAMTTTSSTPRHVSASMSVCVLSA